MNRFYLKSILVILLLFGSMWFYAIGQEDNHPQNFSAPEVIELLDVIGIPADSAEVVHQRQVGEAPQVPQDIYYYRVKYQDVSWYVGVDATLRSIAEIWGETAFVPKNKPKPITTAEDAIHLADVWFQKLGVDMKRTKILQVSHQDYHSSIWKIQRNRFVEPEIFVREGAYIELDGNTGGLVRFIRDPQFNLPNPLPIPKVTKEQAAAFALEHISKTSTEYYEPSSNARVIAAFEFITWHEVLNEEKSDKRNLVAYPYWTLYIVGAANRINHLPAKYEIQKKADSLVWQVNVDTQTGGVDVHITQKQNELFVNGKQYHW